MKCGSMTDQQQDVLPQVPKNRTGRDLILSVAMAAITFGLLAWGMFKESGG